MYPFSCSPALWSSYKYSSQYWVFLISNLCWLILIRYFKPKLALALANLALCCPRSPVWILWEFISSHNTVSIFQDVYLSSIKQRGSYFNWQSFSLWRMDVGSSSLSMRVSLVYSGSPSPADHPITHQDLLWVMMIERSWQLLISC